MPDREKYIEVLRKYIEVLSKTVKTVKEFNEDAPIKISLVCIEDILELLKEQEAKTGHWISVNDGDVVAIDNDGFPERECFCSECKKYLIASDEYAVYGRYCPFCGAKMESR